MSLQANKDSARRRKPDPDATQATSAKPARTKSPTAPANVGDALRSVYQRTVDEDIPPEMLDLLGKLG